MEESNQNVIFTYPNADTASRRIVDAIESYTRHHTNSKCVINLEPGDTVSFQTPGGGGYGNPKKRNPDNVYEDVINNKITYERAEKFYGVVINTKTNKIDNKRTIQKRKNK